MVVSFHISTQTHCDEMQQGYKITQKERKKNFWMDSKLLVWTNMFPIICMRGLSKTRWVCDGHPDQNNLEFSDLKLVFSHQSSWERKTNSLIREIPPKRLISPGLLAVFIESNYFISMVNIISWRGRPLGFLWLWHGYRSVTLLHAREAFQSVHGKFSRCCWLRD